MLDLSLSRVVWLTKIQKLPRVKAVEATNDSPTAQNILMNNDTQKYNVAFSVYDINLKKHNSFYLKNIRFEEMMNLPK